MPVNYLYGVPEGLAEKARATGIVDEHTHIGREFCTCGVKEWGWGLHAVSCPIHEYYIHGGIHAEEVLLSLLEGESDKRSEKEKVMKTDLEIYREVRHDYLCGAGASLTLRGVLSTMDTLAKAYEEDFDIEKACDALEQITEWAEMLKRTFVSGKEEEITRE